MQKRNEYWSGWIKKARKELKLTQLELAIEFAKRNGEDISGIISKERVSKVEHGATTLSLPMYLEICKMLIEKRYQERARLAEQNYTFYKAPPLLEAEWWDILRWYEAYENLAESKGNTEAYQFANNQIDSLKESLEEKTAQVINLEKALSVKTNEVFQLEEKLDKEKKKNSQSSENVEKTSELRKLIKEYKEHIEGLDRQIRSYKAQIENYKNEIQELRNMSMNTTLGEMSLASLKELNDLKDKYEEASQKIKKLEENNKNLKNENDRLEKERKEYLGDGQLSLFVQERTDREKVGILINILLENGIEVPAECKF